jgi:hypothetical protein
VLCSKKSKVANFRADYAKHEDFCEVFEKDAKSLYLLAFVLTANPKESEHCFASTVEKALEQKAVFKEWARSWVKRRMIENAIESAWQVTVRDGQKRDLWSAKQHENEKPCEIDSCDTTSLIRALRFCHVDPGALSDWDCCVLLECSMKKVAQARIGALRRLPAEDASSSHKPSCDEIRLRSYEIYLESGGLRGDEIDD